MSRLSFTRFRRLTTATRLARLVRLAALAALAGLALLVTRPVQAASTYFIKLDGINGESLYQPRDSSLTHWSDVQSFSWGLSFSGSATGGGGSATGRASFQDFVWTQTVDASIPPLFVAVASGKHIPTVTFDVIKAGGNQDLYFEMIFTGALGSSLSLSGSGTVPVANSSFTYSSVTMRYRPQDASGKFLSWIEGSFNLATNSANATAIQFSGDPNVLTGLFATGGNIQFDGTGVTLVPEPGSLALFSLGLLPVLVVARRRRGR